jgi:hypothetical protein
MPSGATKAADPAVRRVDRRQRDACHGRGQRERQIDQRIHDALAGEVVAHQDPGDDQAEERVHQRRDRGRAEAEAQRRQHAAVGQDTEEAVQPQRRRPQHQRGQRQQHDDAEIGDGEAERDAEARQNARPLEAAAQIGGNDVHLSACGHCPGR